MLALSLFPSNPDNPVSFLRVYRPNAPWQSQSEPQLSSLALSLSIPLRVVPLMGKGYVMLCTPLAVGSLAYHCSGAPGVVPGRLGVVPAPKARLGVGVTPTPILLGVALVD